jgi:hypothetical protein
MVFRKKFSLCHHVQAGSGAHPTCSEMNTMDKEVNSKQSDESLELYLHTPRHLSGRMLKQRGNLL